MKNFFIVIASVLALSFLAAAAPPVIDFIEGQVKQADGWHVGSKNAPVKVDGVLYVDQRQGTGSYGGCDGGVGLCYIGKGKLDYDFASLPGGGGALEPGATVCAVSSSVTVTNCAYGDTLMLGIDQAPVNAFITFTTRMTGSGTAEIQACAVGISDGGSANQPDSGFTVRCFR